MKINNSDIDIETLVTEINPSGMIRKCYNNIYLSDSDVEILKKYNFDINNYSNIERLIFDIEEYLDSNYDLELDDLEKISINLSEFNYYQNTNK